MWAVKKKRPPHNGSLKDIKRKKQKAKIALCRTTKEGVAPGVIGTLAKQFFSLVRSHSQLNRASEILFASSNAKKARQQCHQHFQKYATQILDEQRVSSITPDFTLSQPTVSFQICMEQVIGTLSCHLGCQHPHPRRLR